MVILSLLFSSSEWKGRNLSLFPSAKPDGDEGFPSFCSTKLNERGMGVSS